ncbi:MAG: potassium-transporting ATPase subunit KdpC [Actinobacteria bacterium]|nr:potassium-transporting ATPase subunit KdpC [Actinomycetota bacterium]
MKGTSLRRVFKNAALLLVLFIILTGLIYPFVIVGLGELVFGGKAGGNLVFVDGKPVGSSLIGQAFTRDEYFHPRPSAVDYDASLSGPANFGPTNRNYIESVGKRVDKLGKENNGQVIKGEIPVDIVTSSGSGLDPEITPAAARLQAARIAVRRGVSKEKIDSLIEEMTVGRELGFLGEYRVNVLILNLELDKRFPLKK